MAKSKAGKKLEEIRELCETHEYYKKRLEEQSLIEKVKENYKKDLESAETNIIRAAKEWVEITSKKDPLT